MTLRRDEKRQLTGHGPTWFWYIRLSHEQRPSTRSFNPILLSRFSQPLYNINTYMRPREVFLFSIQQVPYAQVARQSMPVVCRTQRCTGYIFIILLRASPPPTPYVHLWRVIYFFFLDWFRGIPSSPLTFIVVRRACMGNGARNEFKKNIIPTKYDWHVGPNREWADWPQTLTTSRRLRQYTFSLIIVVRRTPRVVAGF